MNSGIFLIEDNGSSTKNRVSYSFQKFLGIKFVNQSNVIKTNNRFDKLQNRVKTNKTLIVSSVILALPNLNWSFEK